MKKIILVLMVLCMVASIAACTSPEDSSIAQSSESAAETTPENSAESVSDIPTASSESAHTSADSGTLGDYEIAILSARRGVDYEENPVIIVKYSFTNNATENKAFLFSTTTKAFQDGVQLDSGIIMGDDTFDSGATMKELQPGASIECENAFVLTSEASSVEVNVEEFSFTSNTTLKKIFDPSALS